MSYIVILMSFTAIFPSIGYEQTESVGQGLYKKTEVRYFSVHTEQARLIKSLLYGIYRHGTWHL
jgi:hypothetical protein